MIIWLVNPYGPIEGENWRDYSFNQFGKYLSSKGHEVIWWTSNFAHHFKKYRSEGWKDITVCDGFIIRLIPTSSYKKNFGIGRICKDIVFSRNAAKRFKNEKKPDVILSAENPLTMGKPTFIYAKRNNIPIVVDQMDIWPEFIENKSGNLKSIMHLLFKPVYANRIKNYAQADGYLALGKNYLEFARHVAPDCLTKPYALAYNGVNISEFREHLTDNLPEKVEKVLGKSKGTIRCIFAGTFGPSYDIDVMVECAKRCQKNKLNVDFIFAGSGPRVDEVLVAAKEYDNILYLGSLLPTELVPVYGKCDIGMCAYSKASNVDMPDKFYDYCGAGLAVINSLTEEVAEYIETRTLGINYEGGNCNSMFEAIKHFSDNKSFLEDVKQNSFEIGSYFDCNAQNEKLLNLLEKVVEDK